MEGFNNGAELYYGTELEPEKLSKLLSKAEELLLLIMEYDPLEDRSKKVCNAIRNIFECYSQMNDEESNIFNYKITMKGGRYIVNPIHNVKDEDLKSLPNQNSVATTEDVENCHSRDNKSEGIFVPECETIIKEEPVENNGIDDMNPMPYESIEDTMNIRKRMQIDESRIPQPVIVLHGSCHEVERPSTSHETTQDMRGAFIDMHESGMKASQIAGLLGVNKSTVNRWIARYKAEGSIATKKRSGRPRNPTTITGNTENSTDTATNATTDTTINTNKLTTEE